MSTSTFGRNRRASKPSPSADSDVMLVVLSRCTGLRSTNVPGGVENRARVATSFTEKIEVSGSLSVSASPKSRRTSLGAYAASVWLQPQAMH